MRDPLVIHPPRPRHRLLWLLGAAALLANRLRRLVRPYNRPRDLPSRDLYRNVAYDLMVVDGWERALSNYVGEGASLADCTVAEIGPGPDLGTGVVMLWRGARRYAAFDSSPLAQRTAPRFYQALLERLNYSDPSPEKTAMVQRELERLSAGRPERLEYLPGRGPEALAERGVNLVVSQAVLEHVEDLEGLLSVLSAVTTQGALFVAEVDFQTHTRWLRNRDPLNIYRYSPWFYEVCRFAGSPARRRLDEYRRALQQTGWIDVRIFEQTVLSADYVERIRPHLAREFTAPDRRIEVLSATICARRA